MSKHSVYRSNNTNQPDKVAKRGCNMLVLFLGLSTLIHPMFVFVFVGYYLVKGLHKEAILLFFAYTAIIAMLGISMFSMLGGMGALVHTGNITVVTILGFIGTIGLLGAIVMFIAIIIVTTSKTNEWYEKGLTAAGYEQLTAVPHDTVDK